MRKILVGVGLVAGLACGPVYADTPKPRHDSDHVIASTVRGELTPRERIHERAVKEARERESRIEFRRWNGISLQRPTVNASPLVGTTFYPVSPWSAPIYWAYPIGM